jgi:hypothetical protein
MNEHDNGNHQGNGDGDAFELDLSGDDGDLSTVNVAGAYSHGAQHDDQDHGGDYDDDGDDGADVWQEPEPPGWDDLEIEVGPADAQLIREVGVTCGGDYRSPRYGVTYTKRLFYDRKSMGALKRFLVECGCQFGIRGALIAGTESVSLRILAECLDKAKKADEAATLDVVPEFRFKSFAEMLKTPCPIDWLVEGFLVDHISTLVGKPDKSLKTTLWGIDLGISIACERLFLGMKTRKYRVGIMSIEAEEDIVVRTAGRIIESKQIDPSELNDLVFCPSLPEFTKPKHLDQLNATIKDYDLSGGVLIFDSAYRGLREMQAASVWASAGVYADIDHVCRDNGVMPIVILHTKKTIKRLSKIGLNDVAGAGAAEFFRQWVLGGHRERHRPGSGIHKLHITVGSSAGHGGQWRVDIDEGLLPGHKWTETIEPIETEPATTLVVNRGTADMQSVVAVLETWPQGATQTMIREATSNMPLPRLKKALLALQRRRQIEQCSISRPEIRNKPYPAYKLCDHQ